jgi:hypothetical protein
MPLAALVALITPGALRRAARRSWAVLWRVLSRRLGCAASIAPAFASAAKAASPSHSRASNPTGSCASTRAGQDRGRWVTRELEGRILAGDLRDTRFVAGELEFEVGDARPQRRVPRIQALDHGVP